MDFDIKTLDQMDRARLSAYRSNLDFYNGSQWSERSRYRQLVFNYVKIAVDKVTSYLMNELNFACEGNSGGTKTAEMAKLAEDLIYMVYEQNNCSELDYTTEIDTAILGDGCYKVTWDAAEKRVRITAMDNLAVRDPEAEFEKWMAERRRILEMNSEFKAQPAYGKAREKSTAGEMDAGL